MNWRTTALLLSIVVLGSCAEGGSRGSGIGTLVEGNVVSVESDASASQGIEGIRVAIEDTDAHGRTDAAGRFSLRGSFGGSVSLAFELAEDGATARIAINVPDGGTLTLNDVRIHARSGEATADRQDVDFEGIVTDIDCAASTIVMVSTRQAPSDSDTYTVRLDTSTLLDANGAVLGCGDLRGGERATVQGTVNPDETFGHAVIQLEE
jgi:hypothetical protein